MMRGREISPLLGLMSSDTVISYPIPPYQNVPINAQYYEPSRFVISDITLGRTTIVTTTVDHNYVIGQLVRLLIPKVFGSYQLNEMQGYVISIPSSTQVEIDLYSLDANTFLPSPYTAIITNISVGYPAVITANNSFGLGSILTISGVSGMTEINGVSAPIASSTSSTINLNYDTTGFTPYSSGGVATLNGIAKNVAQILAIGDINSGQINSSGRIQNKTYIPGSFINISPE